MYDMAENNGKTKFTEVLTAFISQVTARKFIPRKLQNYAKKNFFNKCLLFGWLNWICFLLPNLIWKDAIWLYLLLRVNQGNWLLFEKLKGNYSLKRKNQPVRVIRKNRCMLKEASTTRSSRSQMLFKKGVLKNFTIFTGKHLCWSLRACNFIKKRL